MGHKQFEDGVIDILTWPLDMSHNGVTAENVAKKYNVTREEQDAFAATSQQRACAAVEAGVFKDEIVPVELKDRKGNVTLFDTDENPRAGVTAEGLARLEALLRHRRHRYGHRRQLLQPNDAAAAVVIMTRAKAEELGCTPMVAIRGYAIAGLRGFPHGLFALLSSKKLADKLGIDLADVDFFEINEAFASQAYAVMRDLGLDHDKVNIYGGGISLGHPIGATGTILAIKCAYELAVRNPEKKDAMVSMCIGGGQGISMYFTAE